MTPTLTDRVREHEAPHIRSPELQVLDALLRIEELLKNPLAPLKVTPEETPVAKEPSKKEALKQRNPRSL